MSLPEAVLPAEAEADVAEAVVPRRWIGAPDSAWNPTLSLMVGWTVGFAALAVAMEAGALPVWLGVAGIAACFYVAFTVQHDSMHGVAHRNRGVNAWLGRLSGFVLMLPHPLFRAAHLAHHTHTNDPERDPDIMVAYRPAWLRPVWFLLTPMHYRRLVYGGGLLRDAASRREAIVTEALIVGTMVAAVALGHGGALLRIWVLPAVLAILFLAFAFDLLPHLPHTTRERYYDTRAYPGRVLNVLLLGQNYHLVHHLWTTIPWYRYRHAFADVEADLAARGAPVGWRSRAEKPRR